MYCQRQTGVVPDAFGAVQGFMFAGVYHCAALATVTRARAGARGRIEAISWSRSDALPTETDPVARVAVATMQRQIATVATNAEPTAAAVVPSVPAQHLQRA